VRVYIAAALCGISCPQAAPAPASPTPKTSKARASDAQQGGLRFCVSTGNGSGIGAYTL